MSVAADLCLSLAYAERGQQRCAFIQQKKRALRKPPTRNAAVKPGALESQPSLNASRQLEADARSLLDKKLPLGPLSAGSSGVL